MFQVMSSIDRGVFAIVWMKDGAEVARESSALNRAEEVVRYARAKVTSGVMGWTSHRPDEFRVTDDVGHEIARQHITD